MPVSIDYAFNHSADLLAGGELASVAGEWDKAFGGTPYESWGWHAPARDGGNFQFRGATKLPDQAEQAWGAIQIAADLLSRLRNAVGGSGWSVSVDGHELPWDAKLNEFDAS